MKINKETLDLYTYKSVWSLNLKNGAASVRPRKTYPLSFLSKLSRKFSILGKNSRVELDPSLIYESTEDYSGGQQNFCSDADISVQSERADKFADFLKKYKISFDDKSVLDVSGGSGVFVKRLMQYGARDVMNTEFSQAAVSYSINSLGISASKYDLNTDKIIDVIGDGKKFDIVMLRGCIEFCDSLEKLANDLKEITHKKSVIILTFIAPTLGSALRTSFDQYNISHSRPANIVSDIFLKAGYSNAVDTEIFLFDRNYAFSHLKWPFSPFYLFYLIKNLWKLHKAGYPLDFHALDSKCPLLVITRENV